MWCDNCLLLFPLRGGAIAWAAVILLYSTAGGLYLLDRGQYLYFVYPEWEIYGAISLVTGLLAVVSLLALSNRSYIWSRAAKFLWPFVIVISAIRAIIMIVELQRGKDEILWECANGGQLWTDSVTAGISDPGTLPSEFCSAGFDSLNLAFIISLIVDIVFQIYMFFLVWRYSKLLEHYSRMKGYNGGYYA